MGAELAQLDADRADLKRFAELRRQIGLGLVPYRDRVVIVVPEGDTIARRSAPRSVGPGLLQRANVSCGPDGLASVE